MKKYTHGLHNLRMVRLWAYTKNIEAKRATATTEELAIYVDMREVLRENNWSYERTMQVLDAVIQSWEFVERLNETIQNNGGTVRGDRSDSQ